MDSRYLRVGARNGTGTGTGTWAFMDPHTTLSCMCRPNFYRVKLIPVLYTGGGTGPVADT